MNRFHQKLFKKHLAYRQCFTDENGQLTAAGMVVLEDLAKFAAVHSTTTVVSPINRVTDVPASFQREGRREVFTRVWRFLRLPVNQLFELEEKGND